MNTQHLTPTARHRRDDEDPPLVRVRDVSREARRSQRHSWRIPAPSLKALLGLVVLVLIGAGAVHLSGARTAEPVQAQVPPVSDVSAGDTAPSPDAENGRASTAGTDSTPPPGGAEPSGPTGAEEQAVPDSVTVYVSGDVSAPGVVELPAGARVHDAVQAAGGAGEQADLSRVNLARPVTDGEQIHIPTPGEDPPASAGSPPADSSGSETLRTSPSAADESGAGKININTATEEQLQELTGVGPAIAGRIVEHREANGPFQSVEDLQAVSGIGPATLEKIRDEITV